MPEKPAPLLPGTLDLMILKTVTRGPMHGYAIVRHLAAVSEQVILVEEGTLYPALHRLAQKGWVNAQWGKSENGRRAKFYRITDAGRRQLAREGRAWTRLATAITRVLNPAEVG